MIKNYHDKFIFNDWANKQIIKKLSQIKPNEKANEIMGHIVAAQDTWLERIKATPNFSIFLWEPFSVQELEVLSKNSSKAWLSFIGKLNRNELNNICTYKNSKRKDFNNTIEEIIDHVIMHSAYHRGQVNKLIVNENIKPAIIDYIFWLRKFKPSGKE